MSYIEFDKLQLVNLEYMLERELIRSNRSGAFACQTLIGCNTRRYHGLLNVEQTNIDNIHHVLLSSIDETIIQKESEFNFGIHRYKGGHYSPKGHKYLSDFIAEPFPKLIYRVGGVILSKELLFSSKENQVFIKYTLVDAHHDTILRIRPYLAFRNINKLTKKNDVANTNYEKIENGFKMCLYDNYTPLYIQVSKNNEYYHNPLWYLDFEYFKEMYKGYECNEDLLVPGYIDIKIKKGETVIISASTSEVNTKELSKNFLKEIKNRIPRDSFENNLKNTAQQLVINNGNAKIIAGYPWYIRLGRDTFMALPGLTLTTKEFDKAEKIFDSMLKELNGSLFPNFVVGKNINYESADTSLWFFWALQKYTEATNSHIAVWKKYNKYLKQILSGYKNGTENNIKMLDNFLIYSGNEQTATTWMNAKIDNKPVVKRHGCAVEINALWYNAISFALELANINNDKKFIVEWLPVAEEFPKIFKDTFWEKEKGYLCDVVINGIRDWTVRPNMIIATSLPYTPISSKIRELILEKVRIELLTPRGIRTLTPTDINYKGSCSGNEIERQEAYHQGNAYPWLFGHFCEGYLKIFGKSKIPFLKKYYDYFEDTIKEHGIGSVSEHYDGDPPHKAGGAISQAISVAELLRVNYLLTNIDPQL